MTLAQIILADGSEKHYSEVADAAISRGYKGKEKSTREKISKSFWATMKRNPDVFDAMGGGNFKLKTRKAQ